jgi:integrase
MKERKNKGEVGVSLDRDRLRLNWRYAGKRYYLYLGLPDTRINRIVAEGKARMIEGDMATGNFDPTLVKYKPVAAEPESQITADELLLPSCRSDRSRSTMPVWKKYRITHNTCSSSPR